MYKRKIKKVFTYYFAILIFFVYSYLCVVHAATTLSDIFSVQSPFSPTFERKVTVSSLFQHNLDAIKSRTKHVIQRALQSVLQHIYYQAPRCGYNHYFSQADLLHILYYVFPASDNTLSAGYSYSYIPDLSFRNFVHTLLLYDRFNFSPPTLAQRDASCKKLLFCYAYATGNAVSIDVNLADRVACQNIVHQLYIRTVLFQDMHTRIATAGLDTNIFYNGNTKDSDYDIIVDLYTIGRLLFRTYQSAPELVYYHFPSFLQNVSQNDIQNSASNIPIFSNTTGIEMGDISINPTDILSDYTQPTFLADPVSSNFTIPTHSNLISDNLSLSVIDQSFIETINTPTYQPIVPTNPTTVLPASSVCVDLSDSDGSDSIGTTSTANLIDLALQEYKQVLSHYYDDVTKDQQIDVRIRDAILLTGVSLFQTGGNTALTEKQLQDFNLSITQLANSIFSFDDPNSFFTRQSCLASCQGLATTDYTICVAKCLCGQVGSPELRANDFLFIPANAFMLRFCTLPTVPKAVPRYTEVYSIQEILDAIYAVVSSLQQGGTILKHVRTKEFLDSSMKKNKFSDIFSFSIFFSKKSIHDFTPAQHYENQLSAINDTLRMQVLTMGSNTSTIKERNKYVIIDDVASRIALQETSGNPSDLIQRIQNIIHTHTSVFSALSGVRIGSILEHHADFVLYQQMLQFLVSNVQFWDAVLLSFGELNRIAENLKSKIQKAP